MFCDRVWLVCAILLLLRPALDDGYGLFVRSVTVLLLVGGIVGSGVGCFCVWLKEQQKGGICLLYAHPEHFFSFRLALRASADSIIFVLPKVPIPVSP